MEKIGLLTAVPIQANQPFPTLFDYKMLPFNFSWESTSVPHPARYALFTTGDTLTVIFSSPIPAWSDRHDHAKEFVSGLWEYDVGEIFLYAPESGRYQEFNIAPSGAWWSCAFSSYRKCVDVPIAIPTIKSWSESTPAGWRAALEIPLSQLQIGCHELKSLRCNICSIEGKNPRHYLSAATIETPDPDFHHQSSFLPVSTIPS